MDELKSSKKFVDTVMIQTGLHHYEVDWPHVFSADAPSRTSAIGFKDRVAKAAKN